MKHYWWGISAIVIIIFLGIWPVSKGWWQISVGYSATWVGGIGVKTTDSIVSLVRLTKLDSQLKDAEAENTRLRAEIAKLESLKTENDNLRKEIGLVETQGDGANIIAANIIGRSPVNFLQTLTLNRGADSGVEVGQTVTSDGYLVGKVESVTPNSSDVSVITSGKLLIPVTLQTSKGSGVASGGLEGLIVEEVPLDAEVKEGELVITQGLDEIIESGISVGTVRSVVQQKGDIFQKVIAESPLDFSRLDTVIIIK